MKFRHENVQSFIRALQKAGELREITTEVDPHLELAEIHRRTAAQSGPALLFSNVKNSSFPVATNLFGSKNRLEIALGKDIFERIEQCASFISSTNSFLSLSSFWKHRTVFRSLMKMGSKILKKAPLNHFLSTPDLSCLPFLKCWPEDGGSFLTLPLVYTEDLKTKISNLGVYRMQRFSATKAGIHWQVGKGGAFHYDAAEKKNFSLPVSVFLGGPPALILSAIAPLPENCSELLLASFFLEKKISRIRREDIAHALFAEADVAIHGFVPPYERELEGPFGDHYGYQDPSANFPVFHATHMVHRKDAIIPATVVGPPMQEDGQIGAFLQKLALPFIKLLIPPVLDLYTYPETGFHSLCAVRLKERYGKESLSTAFRLLGESQLSLTKILFCLQDAVDLKNIKNVLSSLLSHLRPEDVYIIPKTATDTLDPSAPYRNKGSKLILLGTSSAQRSLPCRYTEKHPLIKTAIAYTPGCLVIDGPSFAELADPSRILKEISLHPWPLIILVDDASSCCASDTAFLWNAFTRYNPSTDIYFYKQHIVQNSIHYEFPMLIDARMKPTTQKPLVADSETMQLVSSKKYAFS